MEKHIPNIAPSTPITWHNKQRSRTHAQSAKEPIDVLFDEIDAQSAASIHDIEATRLSLDSALDGPGCYNLCGELDGGSGRDEMATRVQLAISQTTISQILSSQASSILKSSTSSLLRKRVQINVL